MGGNYIQNSLDISKSEIKGNKLPGPGEILVRVRIWSLAEKLPGGRHTSSTSLQGSVQRRWSYKSLGKCHAGIGPDLAASVSLSPILLGSGHACWGSPCCWTHGAGTCPRLLPQFGMSLLQHCLSVVRLWWSCPWWHYLAATWCSHSPWTLLGLTDAWSNTEMLHMSLRQMSPCLENLGKP